MALNLETLRAVVRGDEPPKYEGEALNLFNEREGLRNESNRLKTESEGRDEIPGTVEFLRLQEVGARIKEISDRMKELGHK